MLIEVLPEMTRVFPKESYLDKVIWIKYICLDIDGVICEFDLPKIVKNFFGVDISKYIIHSYDLADQFGVSDATINHMFKEPIWDKPNFNEGAVETLREWKLKGHKIIIYSNRVKYMGLLGLAKWLTDYDIPFDKIDEYGEGYKHEGEWHDYDFHIDDRPSKLMNTNSKRKLLFNQTWNSECFNIQWGLERVYNWNEISKAVS